MTEQTQQPTEQQARDAATHWLTLAVIGLFIPVFGLFMCWAASRHAQVIREKFPQVMKAQTAVTVGGLGVFLNIVYVGVVVISVLAVTQGT